MPPTRSARPSRARSPTASSPTCSPTAAGGSTTPGSWLPTERVFFAGDLVFNGGTPFVLMGSVDGALDALETLRSFNAATIVPGHGPVCGPEVIDDVRGYLELVRDVAVRAHQSGLSPL